MYEELEWDCTSDNIKYQKIMEKKIFTFLAGLNKNLDEVRGRILSTKPLPLLREACSKVPTKRESKEGHDEGSQLVKVLFEQQQISLGHQVTKFSTL